MNTLSTTTAGQIPARQLAQLRLMATSAGLSPVLASAFADGAASRSLSADLAERAAQGVAYMTSTPAASGIDEASMTALVDDFMTKMAGTANADATAIAGEILMTHLAQRDARNPINRASSAQAVQSFQGHSWDSPRGIAMKAGDALAAALGARIGVKLEPTMGQGLGQVSVDTVAMNICRAAGLRPQNPAEAIRMAGAHSGSDFAFAIQSGLTGIVGRGFEVAQPAIARLAIEVPAPDYRQRNSVTLSSTGVPQKVLEGGEVKSVTVSEKGELAAKLDDFAAMFTISNQALANDSSAMGLLSDIGRKMIQGSVQQFRNVLVAPLLANSGAGQTMLDGQPLFHTSHGNIAASGAVISVTSVGVARTAMRRQVDAQGLLLSVEPRFLLVPPEQETLAQQLVAQITATKQADANPFTGALEVVCEPGLSNSTAWYLVGDPMLAQGLTWASLEGSSSPRVESQPGWNTLGMEFRLVWAIGSAFVETASWYRNAGA